MPAPVAAPFLKKSLRLIPLLDFGGIGMIELLNENVTAAPIQTVEYFRHSVLILSISLGTPVEASSLPSYSADM